jgi:D-amino peptidase
VKVFISVDFEGATGVSGWDDVIPGRPRYEYNRRYITRDVNSAIEGALDAGCNEILINDVHDMVGSTNIILDELPSEATLITGYKGKKNPLMEGIDNSFEASFLIGYHSRAGTDASVMSHTMLLSVLDFWINDVVVGETGLAAVQAGYYDVPVNLVVGDDKVGLEAKQLLGNVETVSVKKSLDRLTAELVKPEITAQMIREAAKKALSLDLEPYKPSLPVEFKVEMTDPDYARKMSFIPGVKREGSRRVYYTADNVLDAWMAIYSGLLLVMYSKSNP